MHLHCQNYLVVCCHPVDMELDGSPQCLGFAAANALHNRVREVTTGVSQPVTMVLIGMKAVNYIDLEG